MIEKYLNRTDFTSYEDFRDNCKLIIPENFNFAFDVIDDIAERTPDKTALKWTDVEGNYKELTFKELKDLSCQAANYFINLGVKKGDFVMLILKRRYEFWIAIIGLHRIGAVAVPATHMLTKKDIVYRNNAANIKMILAAKDDRIIEQIDLARSESPTVEIYSSLEPHHDGWDDFTVGISKMSTEFNRPTSGEYVTHNDDYFLMYFTSGTTGHPKMVIHDFTYPLGHIYTAHFWQHVDRNGVHLTVADTGWAKCAWGKIYGQWIAETCIFVYDYEHFVAKDMLNIIQDHKLTTFCAPPTIYRYFIKEDLSKYDFSHLKHLSTAGEPLNGEVFLQIEKAIGHKIFEGFGQTETTVLLGTFDPYCTPKPGSMGLPCPNYDIDLVDENGNSVEIGDEGEIVIRTHNGKPAGLFCGYYKDEEKTNEVFYDDMYHIGDIAWKDEDGYYWFVGRADDVIKSSGYRIGPFEVESALIEHPAVLECAITGVPDPDRGTIVKATIVLSKGYTPSDALVKELQNHVKTTTAPYKYPRVVEFVDELPKTISGKIKRSHIRKEDNQ